ncbi:CorA family divalent cation transporter [Leucobacter sp. M11]|uniref:CorA family divalent cation transporter n=1 Tax=Leucobacter sp. M11 TaxID=2993565 RepID=UPI002D7E409F|nr:CorA family divalent cation transporter [Leucobacter sp. M11]MEB4613641.1 hypothetical protein [Leucobacter sp. M11]
MTQRTWTRAFVDGPDDLLLAERAIAARIGQEGRRGLEGAFPLRLVTPDADGARVSELTVLLRPDEIITLEPGNGVPLLQDVEARLLWDDDGDRGATGVGVAIVRAGFQANADSLGMIEADIRQIRASMHGFAEEAGSSRGMSVSDLPGVGELLTDIDAVLSHVSYSVGRLTQLARLLRRAANGGEVISRDEVDALIQQGDALSGRVEFLVERQRFHARGTAEQIATSDLNIVKIFTVLWAILIPGSTLINWYGQNFEFMPELSWYSSSWVQILGVFCLAVIPIYTVKRAGQLR